MGTNAGLALTCTLVGIIGTLNIFVLSLLLSQIRGLREDIKGIYKSLDKKMDKEDVCKETSRIWQHVHHHSHNGGGRVVMPPGD